jgi:uncharacterized protein YijF (DUF1287 family)
LVKNKKRLNIRHLLIIILVLLIAIAVIITVNKFSFKKEYEPATALSDLMPRYRLIDMDNIPITGDADDDGINDQKDIMQGAKDQLGSPARTIRVEEGENNYFKDGDPPEELAISTDIIARAFLEAGFNLRDLVNEDISNNFDQYPIKEMWGRSFCDPNIDYRRVLNMEIFFKRNAEVFDIFFNALDEKNLNSWLPGDVVFFDMDEDGFSDNIGIISDNTTRNGVPKIIYNYIDPGYTVEMDILKEKVITGHYRFPNRPR